MNFKKTKMMMRTRILRNEIYIAIVLTVIIIDKCRKTDANIWMVTGALDY